MAAPKRRLKFVTLDVFTSTPLEGNQLAVFTNAKGLTDAEMQLVAREMNLSETTFMFRRDSAIERDRGVRVRIFTVDEELPFAGHPTLGTATVLHDESPGAQTIYLDLNVGKIPVEFTRREGLPFGQMTQRDPEFGQRHSREDVARATGLSLSDISEDAPIQTVSTGNAFAIVPLASLAALENLAPSWAQIHAYLQKTDAKFFDFVSRQYAGAHDFLSLRRPGHRLRSRTACRLGGAIRLDCSRRAGSGAARGGNQAQEPHLYRGRKRR